MIDVNWIPIKELSTLTKRSSPTLRAEYRKIAKTNPIKANKIYKLYKGKIYGNKSYFLHRTNTKDRILDIYNRLIYDLDVSKYSIAQDISKMSNYTFSKVYSLFDYLSFLKEDSNIIILDCLEKILERKLNENR